MPKSIIDSITNTCIGSFLLGVKQSANAQRIAVTRERPSRCNTWRDTSGSPHNLFSSLKSICQPTGLSNSLGD